MSRAQIHLTSEEERDRAIRWVRKAPHSTRLEFRRPKRTIPQNDRMWAMLTIIAENVEWHGVRLVPEDWKLIFMDALNREMRIVPNLDGTGFVNLGRSSSSLSKDEHSDLTALIEAFATRQGVALGEQAA